jgi:Golgi phosphoprotein 3 (GPP34)
MSLRRSGLVPTGLVPTRWRVLPDGYDAGVMLAPTRVKMPVSQDPCGSMHSYRLSDEFFLIGHDEFTGKPAINRELIACGLSAALLAELMILGRLCMHDGRVALLDTTPAGEAVADQVLDLVAQQSKEHTVRTWTEHLGEPAYELVARRLVDEGVVRREQSRRMLGRGGDRFPPVDLYQAARARLWLGHMITHPLEMDLQRTISAGLVTAVGVERVLGLELDSQQIRDIVSERVSHLPEDLQSLLLGVNAAVAALSLTIRR